MASVEPRSAACSMFLPEREWITNYPRGLTCVISPEVESEFQTGGSEFTAVLSKVMHQYTFLLGFASTLIGK